MKRSHLSIAITVLIGILAAGAGVWAARTFSPPAEVKTAQATYLPDPRPLPHFELVDHTGAAFGPERLKGHWSLVFFGFTHCPAICPNTLMLMQKANRMLADMPADERPQLVFISVDPERDTPEKMAEYVRFYSESMVGVTGDPTRIAAFTKALGVPVAKVPRPDGGYEVDHSAAIFLINPEGEFNALFSTPHQSEAIARDYRTIVKASS